jgi:hypothetical protein
MVRNRSIARVCVLGLGVLAGCAGPVERRAVAPSVGEQGGSWEVVLPGAATQLAMGPESSRRDETLGGIDEAPAWADRPSLDHARRLQLDERADEYIYFRSARTARLWYGWR